MIEFLLFAKLPLDRSEFLTILIDESDTHSLLQKAFLVLLLIVLAWLIYSFAKSQKPKPKLGYALETMDYSGTLKLIKSLEKEADKSQNYRQATHHLSELIRKFIKEKNDGRIRAEFMTAEELQKILENKVSAELLLEISKLQFDKDVPDEHVFKETIKKVLKNAEQKHFATLKKGALG